MMHPSLAAIVAAHRSGAATPAETVAASYARIRAHADPAVFITLREEAEAIAEAAAGAAAGPLAGVPIAMKDSIDVAGLPTTAGCPAFAYTAEADATCVARLRRAGAIVVGKTNLDQFATGLVGTRTPYGIARNPLKPGLIPGGSSAGSAVAVAAGLVPVALGSDTAGSGRVPAALNNIVGLKPSPGLISNHGTVPACRTLDCISVFALTVDDAFAVLAVIAGPDDADPYSRALPLGALGPMPDGVRLGVPATGERRFFGDRQSEASYEAALARLARLGATIVEIDIAPYYEAARLLYEGPWVAERYIAARSIIESAPGSDASGHPANHSRRRQAERGRYLYGALQAAGAAPRARSHVRADRCAGAADHSHRLYGGGGARRSDRAQQPARHLHQLRQPARALRARAAGIDRRGRRAVRHHAGRPRR